MKPVIGISASVRKRDLNGREITEFVLRQEYVDRVVEAGGIPFIIPAHIDPAAVAEMIDGWLIPGGDDLPSELWGEELHPEVQLEPRIRPDFEMSLYAKLPEEMPIFGICYGCQLLNILHRGSLHQHLPDILNNDIHRGDPVHDYRIEPGSKLAAIVGDSAAGKSSHHQAVNQLGKGLKITARHEDGTVEALESESRPWVIGVQWHPERSEAEATPKLFHAFIEAARAFKENRTSCGTW